MTSRASSSCRCRWTGVFKYWLPTQKATELFPKVGHNPPKVLIVGGIGDAEADEAALQRVLPQARAFFYQQAHGYSLGVLGQQDTGQRFADGAARYINQFGEETYVVYIQPVTEEVLEKDPLTGFIGVPASDGAVFGWGAPYADEGGPINGGLGTVFGNGLETVLRVNKDDSYTRIADVEGELELSTVAYQRRGSYAKGAKHAVTWAISANPTSELLYIHVAGVQIRRAGVGGSNFPDSLLDGNGPPVCCVLKGKKIAVIQRDAVSFIDLDGANPRTVATLPETAYDTYTDRRCGWFYHSVSPDGTKIVLLNFQQVVEITIDWSASGDDEATSVSAVDVGQPALPAEVQYGAHGVAAENDTDWPDWMPTLRVWNNYEPLGAIYDYASLPLMEGEYSPGGGSYNNLQGSYSRQFVDLADIAYEYICGVRWTSAHEYENVVWRFVLDHSNVSASETYGALGYAGDPDQYMPATFSQLVEESWLYRIEVQAGNDTPLILFKHQADITKTWDSSPAPGREFPWPYAAEVGYINHRVENETHTITRMIPRILDFNAGVLDYQVNTGTYTATRDYDTYDQETTDPGFDADLGDPIYGQFWTWISGSNYWPRDASFTVQDNARRVEAQGNVLYTRNPDPLAYGANSTVTERETPVVIPIQQTGAATDYEPALFLVWRSFMMPNSGMVGDGRFALGKPVGPVTDFQPAEYLINFFYWHALWCTDENDVIENYATYKDAVALSYKPRVNFDHGNLQKGEPTSSGDNPHAEYLDFAGEYANYLTDASLEETCLIDGEANPRVNALSII